MKKSYLLFGLALAILAAILIPFVLSSEENENDSTDAFAREGQISLLIVSNEKDSSDVMDDLVAKGLDTSIGPIKGLDNLEDVRADYPYLEIDKLPSYVVFNSEKPVYQTNKYEDLLTYLDKYNVN